ncbi:Uncharacterised protein [uncultured archaeon]|nr:Uncharacterised protein [uncultured archaeon]
MTGQSATSISLLYNTGYVPSGSATPLPEPTLTPTPTPAPASGVAYDTLTLVADTSNRSIVTDTGTVTGEFMLVQSSQGNVFTTGNNPPLAGPLLILADGGNAATPPGTVFSLPATNGRAYARQGTLANGVTFLTPVRTVVLTGGAVAANLVQVNVQEPYGTGALILRFEGASGNGRNQFVTSSTGTDSTHVIYAPTGAISTATVQTVPYNTPAGLKVTSVSTTTVQIQVPQTNTPNPTPTATPTPSPTATATPTPTASATPTPSASASVTYDTFSITADTSNRSIVTQNGTATGEFFTIQSAQSNAFYSSDSSFITSYLLVLADGGSQSFPVGTVFSLPNTGSMYTKHGAISSGVTYQYANGATVTLSGASTGKGLQLILPEAYGSGAVLVRFEGATNNGRNQFVTTDTGTDSTHILIASSASNPAGSATVQTVPYTTSGGLKVTSVSTSTLSVLVPQSHP